MNAKAPIADQLHRLHICPVGKVLVINHADRRLINENLVQEFGQELLKLIETSRHTLFLLSFANVESYSAEALGKVITAHKKAFAQAKQLKLCGIRPEILEVFTLTKLDKFFDIQDDEAAALASF